MSGWIDHLVNEYTLSQTELMILYLNLTLFFGAVSFVLILFGSRVTKSYQERRTIFFKEKFRTILNAIAVHESEIRNRSADPVLAFRWHELKSTVSNSPAAEDLLIHQLLELKKNLTGNSAQILVDTYYGLKLEKASLRKLKSLRWRKKALGIRELAEMGHRESLPFISRHLNSQIRELREEAFMGVARLEKERPLHFLDQYIGEITPWMRLNIYNYLQKLDSRTVPEFARWFDHKSISVQLFSLSMTRQFRQLQSLPKVAGLLHSTEPAVVRLALKIIGELEGFEFREHVIALHDRAWPDARLSRRFVKCLGMIGDPALDSEVIAEFLTHFSYDVRLEAATALLRFGETGKKVLMEYNIKQGNSLDVLITHLSEPLLN
jgi:hypothetical protein